MQISEIARGDYETFIVKHANHSSGGADYLLTFEYTRRSKNNVYKDFINKLGEDDEIFSIGKFNACNLLAKICGC